VNPGAIERFHAAQSRNLEQTYDHAWRQGVASYEPQDPEPAPDKNPAVATAPVGTGAALLTRRQQAYREPAAPDAARRARALEPASAGLAKMTDELHQLTPTQEHMQTAEAAARSGEIDAGDMDAYAEALAAGDWLESNAWRLDAGDSVAWSGEQAGYAEAADADGQLLEWLPESDEHVCEDCGSLGELPPMPLSDWPTTPGSGDTACNVGCRCVLQVSDEQLGPNGELPPLSQTQEGVISEIASRREPATTGYRESQQPAASSAALSPDRLAAVRRVLAGMGGG